MGLPEKAPALAERFDAFFFDLDGVVYVGDRPLPGAVEALGRLREMGRAVRFLTNDPRFSRAELAVRLSAMGVQAAADEVISCGWATAVALRRQGVRSAHVVGTPSLAGELQALGIDARMEGARPGEVEAVVIGAGPHLGYLHILQAARLVLAGARLVATNADASFPLPDGPAPGTGAIVRAVEAATGVRSQLVGKPQPLMFRLALETLPAGARAVVVGDNPLTDVLGAHRTGLPAVLVAPRSAAAAGGLGPLAGGGAGARRFLEPEAVVEGLMELFRPGLELRPWAAPSHGWADAVRPGVGAVVVEPAGRVLWVRRRDNGLWGLPSGHVEPGESVEQAVLREVQEETGLQVRVVRLSGVYSAPDEQVVVYPSGEAVQFVTCVFLCRVEGGRLRPDGDEVDQAEFREAGQAPKGAMAAARRWAADALGSAAGPAVR